MVVRLVEMSAEKKVDKLVGLKVVHLVGQMVVQKAGY